MKALVVDDLSEIREMVAEKLGPAGFDVAFAEDGRGALGALQRAMPDLIVTDFQERRRSGAGFIRRVRAMSDVPVVVLTAVGSIPDCEDAMRAGADRYLQLKRDLDRIGEVAIELVRDGSPPRQGAPRAVTAADARSLAVEELRALLQKLVVECKGNIAEMGRRMGKDRSTVRYHLRRFGMLENGETSVGRVACGGFASNSVSRGPDSSAMPQVLREGPCTEESDPRATWQRVDPR